MSTKQKRGQSEQIKDWAQFTHTLCMRFPEAEHLISHGAPNYRIGRGKIFALFALNHHGDGRAALWVNAPAGAHEQFEASKDSVKYFIPPYLGVRGWLGLDLNALSAQEILARLREAYLHTLPERKHPAVSAALESIEAPTLPLDCSVANLDPLQSPLAAEVLEKLRARFSGQSPVQETTSYGMPCWRTGAGKSGKAFAMLFDHQKQLALMLNAGPELQSLVLQDSLYFSPPYFGARGWVACLLSQTGTLDEIEDLLSSCLERASGPSSSSSSSRAGRKP